MNLTSLFSIGAAGVSLLLSIWLLVAGFMNRGQQDDWQKQQQEMQTHQQTLGNLQQQAQIQQQQIQAGRQLAEQGKTVLQEIGSFVVPPKNNEKLKSLLARHGVSVTLSTPAASPGAKPATPER